MTGLSPDAACDWISARTSSPWPRRSPHEFSMRASGLACLVSLGAGEDISPDNAAGIGSRA
jgi:hypothetical protein